MTEEKGCDEADEYRVGSDGERTESGGSLFHCQYIEAEIDCNVQQSIYRQLSPLFFLRKAVAQDAMGDGEHKKSGGKEAGDADDEGLGVLESDLGSGGGGGPEDGEEESGGKEQVPF